MSNSASSRSGSFFGYAISAKRYALYSQSGNELRIEKTSGHGLGYLFGSKETKKDKQTEEEGTPKWVLEAWEFLLRKELQLSAKEVLVPRQMLPSANAFEISHIQERRT